MAIKPTVKRAAAAAKRKVPTVNKHTTLGYAVYRNVEDPEGEDFCLHPLTLVSERIGQKTVSYLTESQVFFSAPGLIDVAGFATRGSAQAAITRSLTFNPSYAGYNEGDFIVNKIVG